MHLHHEIVGSRLQIPCRVCEVQKIVQPRRLRSDQCYRRSSSRTVVYCAATSQKTNSVNEKNSPVVGNVAEMEEEQEKDPVPEATVTSKPQGNILKGELKSYTIMGYTVPTEKIIVVGRNGLILFFAITFLISLFNSMRKFLSPTAKRKRTVNRNRELIEELVTYLPDKRAGLTERSAKRISVRAGFSATEVFRKYLWFLLRERKFDQTAVDDLICLKKALKLREEDVATALKERAERIYEKYGTLMLNTEGMTSSGIERKATCQALFSKILFLAEYEELLNPESEASKTVNLKEIFGATEDDESKLRIVSLEEVDLDKLDQMLSKPTEAKESEE